ncbi:MAG: 30S ribosomal protein S17 [Chloroflexi bacterium]|nr:30S ribosomal protein S17 [Chloroflexota bacterium]MCH8160926.1 30S ribosomal protein S17 [Chloroflexota bacterium]
MAEGQRKTMTGRVMSDKMDKTVVVMVQTTTRHRLYKKVIRRSKRYLAHDEGDAKPGDTVLIEETRPYSRNKRWRVAEVLRRGEVADIAPREIDSEYLSMQRQVETPAPPPPRKEDDGQEAVEAPEAEASEAVAEDEPASDEKPGETEAEESEASAAVEEAAAQDEPASDETTEETEAEEPEASVAVEEAAAQDEPASDETPEETGTEDETAVEASSEEPASDEAKPAEDEDDKA